MDLGEQLPPTTHYVPADEAPPAGLVFRGNFHKTKVCDLNAGFFPTVPPFLVGQRSYVAALGVIEYMCDVPSFLAALRLYRAPVVVSYAAVDTPNSTTTTAMLRENSFTSLAFQALLSSAGFRIGGTSSIPVGGLNNVLYNLTPV
mmetsp:Transcript_20487/g.46861  ORF Transcript_20487/g.46861 Transcript_20487/m.46861 type:complete len:145 (-) Transcript_20487:21-455(-)